jgi:hypothetical protein
MSPSHNLFLWDSLFYKRLESSINLYIKQINKQNNDFKNKNPNKGLENINGIKQQ